MTTLDNIAAAKELARSVRELLYQERKNPQTEKARELAIDLCEALEKLGRG